MEAKHNVHAEIVFFGEPCRIPEPGEEVVLHAADDSWQSGFRCISAPLEKDGEQVVWVTREEWCQQALREGRMPAGTTWPLDQLVGVG